MRIRRCRTVAPVGGARCVMPVCLRQRFTRLQVDITQGRALTEAQASVSDGHRKGPMSKDLIALLTVLAAAMWAGVWALSPRYPEASVVRMPAGGSAPPLSAPIEIGPGRIP